jgi:Tol biopolymer transport system component
MLTGIPLYNKFKIYKEGFMMPVQPHRKTLLALSYLSCLMILTGCVPNSNRFGIIFTSSSAGAVDIYRIPDNTQSKIEQLTFTPTIGEHGLLASENGDRIIFGTDFYSDSEMKSSELAIEELRHIYLLDTTSKKLADITNILEDKYPQIGSDFFMDWSPNQKQFVVLTDDIVDSEIRDFLELVNFDGGNKKRILIPNVGEIPSVIHTVQWSPDGKKFALTQGVIGAKQQWENPGAAILVYDLESENIIQITDYKDHCLPREWSPTSQQIAATCSYVPPYSADGVSGPETVRILDVENPGQPYEHISFSPCYDPSWSPDGKQIAFICDKGTDQAGLFIANSDGNEIHEVKLGNLGNPAFLWNPTWSPNGTQIIYEAGVDYGRENIYSIHPDGSNNYALTNQEAFYNVVSVYPLP